MEENNNVKKTSDYSEIAKNLTQQESFTFTNRQNLRPKALGAIESAEDSASISIDSSYFEGGTFIDRNIATPTKWQ